MTDAQAPALAMAGAGRRIQGGHRGQGSTPAPFTDPGKLPDRPRPEAAIPPDELSLSIDLSGPRIDAGEAVLQAIEDAGAVDEWLAATGRLEGRPLWFRIVATRALHLRYQARFDEVQSSCAQNEALISLLLIPVATLLFAALYLGAAPLRGHMSLVALLVAVGLLLEVAHQATWLLVAMVGLAGPALIFGFLIARVLLLVGDVQYATRGFYGLGWARSLLTTPIASFGLGAAWRGLTGLGGGGPRRSR